MCVCDLDADAAAYTQRFRDPRHLTLRRHFDTQLPCRRHTQTSCKTSSVSVCARARACVSLTHPHHRTAFLTLLPAFLRFALVVVDDGDSRVLVGHLAPAVLPQTHHRALINRDELDASLKTGHKDTESHNHADVAIYKTPKTKDFIFFNKLL